MSSFGSQIRKRVKELQVLGDKLPDILSDCVEDAAKKAVEAATQATPPNTGDIAGTNTRSGQLAQHWVTDSVTIPMFGKTGQFKTILANNMQYASYVNDGHRMDKHFVPGLIPNGDMLERVDPDVGGIVVGTKTTYVEGLYMKERGIGKWRTTLRKNLEREVRKLER